MRFVVTIDTDNAAFDGLPGYELARILRELANDMGAHGNAVSRALADANGNVVGKSELVESKYYGWTNWDTRESSLIIDSSENWYLEALNLHVDELREVFSPRVEEFTAGTNYKVDPSSVNWLEIYAALHGV